MERVRISIVNPWWEAAEALMIQYAHNSWLCPSLYEPHIHMFDTYRKQVVIDDKCALIEIDVDPLCARDESPFQDMRHRERFDAYIFMYDVTSRESFARIKRTLETAAKTLMTPSPEYARAEAKAIANRKAQNAAMRKEFGVRDPEPRHRKWDQLRSLQERLSATWRGKKRREGFTYFPQLPIELKLQILRACLTSCKPIDLYKPHKAGININVLRACKLFHEEGTKIFWTENSFLPRQSLFIVADFSFVTELAQPLIHQNEVRALVGRFDCEFYESSSKNNGDVVKVFTGVVRRCRAKKETYA
ncbi:uncharacterized protein BJX67DRAFT_366134 [Aspergillus lucknowensis]|uniref:Uncharacterized protein n=1 Tax=Aspergillus lucknowensis TaxID=176173 RepID=A0ABR4LDJ4_9EURO